MAAAPLPRLGGLGSFDGVDEFEDFPAEPTGAESPTPTPRRPRWTDSLPKPDALLEGLNGPQRRAVIHRGKIGRASCRERV